MNTKNSAHRKLSNAFAERGNRIREKLNQALLSGVQDPQLHEIMEKASSSWRDVFRPALTSLCCEAVGGQPEAADDASLMFTLASMGFGVHDDIIDKTSYKKFQKTIPGKYGIQRAILVGDLFIVKGWTNLCNLLIKNYPPEKITLIIQIYGNLNVQICEAELVDALAKRKLDITVEQHKDVLWKAMAEVEACTRIGAILGDGTQTEIEALANYGRYLGVNFRLLDEVRDCLNIEGNLIQRIKNESAPLPLLFAAHSSSQRFKIIESIIKKRAITPLDLRELVGSCFDSEAFNYITQLAKENEEKASICLDKLKSSEPKDLLGLLLKRPCQDIKDLFR